MHDRVSRTAALLTASAPFAEFYQAGATPDDVKRVVMLLLVPYSRNPAGLEKHSVELMAADAITLARLQHDPDAMVRFGEALRIHHEALDQDQGASLRALAARQPQLNAGLAHFWNILNLTQDLNALEPEEHLHAAMRLIGELVEGPLRPHLALLAEQEFIRRSDARPATEVDELSLGNLVELLRQGSPATGFMEVGGLRINQWRNVAQHLSAELRGSTIIIKPQASRFARTLTRLELDAALMGVANSFAAFKTAHALTFFDHLETMRTQGLLTPSPLRREAVLGVLVAALATQGFEVAKIDVSATESRLVVRDISQLDPKDRRLHSSQFVVPLFDAFPADRVVVEYWSSDGTPWLRTTASRTLLERAARDGDFARIAREAEMADLRVGHDPE